MARRTRRILSVASECVPLMKTGGLADVVGALPAALEPLGWSSKVLLPAYPGLLDRVERGVRVWCDEDLFGGPAAVVRGTVDGLKVLLLDAPHLFARDGGPYSANGHDHHDNHIRFAALSWVGAQIAMHGTSDRWKPDVVHVHDWQAGLVPSYLKYAGSSVPTVMTVHNIAFQGIVGSDELDSIRLPRWDFTPEALEYHGNLSTLKAGMIHASRLTTVSPSYAQELTTPEFGFGLEGVVSVRRERGELWGIINGIDTKVWDPAADEHVVPYSVADPVGKAVNRQRVLDEFNLEQPTGPLAVVVTRLTYQKGIDLMVQALPGFLERGGAVAILGSGDAEYEAALSDLAARYPGKVGLCLGYDEALSHRLYAAGDVVLVPSRFEPSGLTQLYGMRYGAIPVVAATGGLRDTVCDATPENLEREVATGFTFGDAYLGGTIDAGGLSFALGRAADLYADTPAWEKLRTTAMTAPVSWDGSAQQYHALLSDLVS
ncbi:MULTISPECIES: glycogen synthase GlgA [unclassified Rothia (in: high G+C Gram-positive bacteria)]|uniref:glycogen synthase GlgA n=1 Tax=unclassified Rothia (in: high G+C Gram-positive bacteria) TaxID=2689056 RepID=UPI00195C7BB9|nr:MULTISPECIES: glycogen synthase GlgA [unclassified Rothia (in: high G+C Gram-positive bacteria)]MBM7050742.1 glycogen synthase GlgA [Rothia sp. ZJ1223]QRZ60924.1 glycogen synthase GlgA [Rothia sp. ZJ932]